MRIALAQLNPTVGDVAGNTAAIVDSIVRARSERADVLVCSELAVIGYPPRDLLLREGVVEACEEAVEAIAREADEMHVLVGYPRRKPGGLRGLRNSVAVCHQGEVIAVADKQLLPGYDVFDEDRYFDPGEETLATDIAGRRVGVLICEDFWHGDDVDALVNYKREPVKDAAARGCEMIIAVNASPFIGGKFARHLEQLREHATRMRVPIVSVNQVGANDDLVFDGRSVIVNERGEVVATLPAFESAVEVVDVDAKPQASGVKTDPMREVFDAIVLCVRDYLCKTGASRAILGLSGGVDSALTAVIAAKAIGAENVIGVIMPSQYSSRGSIADAKALVVNLGIGESMEVPIHLAHEVMKGALAGPLGDVTGTLSDENVQARLRGLLLMAISNATAGSLLLSTSNKSEVATGYSTLYGDMCGAVSPIGDLTKTRVYEMSRWLNENYEGLGFAKPPIPEESITKPPSAELRPNQTDQDSLPPYELLDMIVERCIEREQTAETIVKEMGLDAAMVEKFTRMIDRAQYKREQASVIPKVTAKAFGRGRVMPIVMKTSKRPNVQTFKETSKRRGTQPGGTAQHNVETSKGNV